MSQEETAVSGIPRESQAAFDELLAEDPRDLAALQAQIEGCLAMVKKYAQVNRFVDVDFVEQIAEACRCLLVGFDQREDQERELIQAAVRYFVLVEDSDNDLNSPTGFDDDAQVVRAVAVALDVEIDL